MKPFSILILGLAVLFINACKEELTQPNNLSPIVGTWVERGIAGDTTIMQRTSVLDADKYGFVFGVGGRFLERKNIGWCGTPPITYGNFEGEWTRQTDSVMHIDVESWAGQTHYDMRIVSLSLSELRFMRETVK